MGRWGSGRDLSSLHASGQLATGNRGLVLVGGSYSPIVITASYRPKSHKHRGLAHDARRPQNRPGTDPNPTIGSLWVSARGLGALDVAWGMVWALLRSCLDADICLAPELQFCFS